MTRETRVPPTEITGIFGAIAKRYTKRKLGEVPESLGVMWHNRPVLRTLMGFFGKAERWDACDTQLKSFAHMAAVAQVGCSACLDFGYLQARDEKLDMDKARLVPRWRESEAFTPLERDVLEYAEAMTETPPAVTDELSERLLDALGAPALLELTAFIAAANMVSRSNVALGIESQGFAAACGLPPLATRRRPHERPVRHPPQPALHRRLRDARLGGRRRGRRAGDLAAVGRRRSGRGARPACLPGPDRHAAGARPAAHGRAPARGLRGGVAARAAAHEPRRGRGRRARRERLDRDAHRARDARPGRARGVPAARGVRPAVRRDRGGRRQERRRRAADRAPRPGARPRAQAADVGEPRRAAGCGGPVPRRAHDRQTCRACWTCSHPT